MRRVTGLTGLVGGVLFADDLGELRRFGDICFVTARAKRSGVGEFRNHRSRITGMVGQRPVAGFAIYMRMLAGLLHVNNVRVALLTGLVTGVGDWARRDFCQGL